MEGRSGLKFRSRLRHLASGLEGGVGEASQVTLEALHGRVSRLWTGNSGACATIYKVPCPSFVYTGRTSSSKKFQVPAKKHTACKADTAFYQGIHSFTGRRRYYLACMNNEQLGESLYKVPISCSGQGRSDKHFASAR